MSSIGLVLRFLGPEERPKLRALNIDITIIIMTYA
jgi:hypothetical protein